jgi:uncharacterized protein
MTKKIKSKKSKISGKGLFAGKKIKKGETICFMKGDLIDIHEMIGRVDNKIENGSDPLGVDNETYMDIDEPYRSANHSCSPNSFIRGRNELVALKKIEKDEEITFDYSTTMNDNKKIIKQSSGELWTMKCKCKTKNCRGIVDQFKTLPKKTKDFYIKNKFAPDFILTKFS